MENGTGEKIDNDDNYVLVFTGFKRYYVIRNKMSKVDLSIYLDKDKAIEMMKKRKSAGISGGDELLECVVSTQHGNLNIYNAKNVGWNK
jgi:hypothetical protein